MSDDEYYDDEYADFHDMLYDADPDPDLADDLAEHAAYSPVWFDNPNEETRDYFSDWDYYSDDYFDDDPVLLSTLSQDMVEPSLTSRSKRQPAKRGRKRKLSEARERTNLDTRELGALKACIKGTVWKSKSPEPSRGYTRGHTKPVALRLNKSIMKSAYNTKQGFGMGGTRDESWANDLSLADMGLRTETSMDLPQGSKIVKQEDGDEDDESIYEDEDLQELSSDGDVHSRNGDADTEIASPRLARSKFRPKQHSESMQIRDSEEEGRSPKRRRKMVASESSTGSKDNPNTPDTSLSSDMAEIVINTESGNSKALSEGSGGRSKKLSVTAQKQVEQHESMGVPNASLRKRRLSSVEDSGVASVRNGRSKRVAMSSPSSNSGAADETGTRKLRSSASRNHRNNGTNGEK